MADSRKLVIRVPGVPDGEPVEVLFLGLHTNGSNVTVSDDDVSRWETLTGRTWPKSGYVIAGEPKTDAEKKAFEGNTKELNAQLREVQAESDKVIAESTTLIPGTSVPVQEEGN